MPAQVHPCKPSSSNGFFSSWVNRRDSFSFVSISHDSREEMILRRDLTVGVVSFNLPVVATDFCHDALSLHVSDSWAEMNARNLPDALTLIGTEVDSDRTVVALVVAIGGGRPCRSPEFCVGTVFPVNNIFLVALVLAGRQNDSFTVFVEIVYFVSFRESVALFVHTSQG